MEAGKAGESESQKNAVESEEEKKQPGKSG
jgi:hypothetical protein